MPLFTPPTVKQGSNDHFFGRYSIDVGQSVLLRDGVYVTTPYPALMEIADLVEGEGWFQGGRTYVVSDEIGSRLEMDGYLIDLPGYGQGLYGYGLYGD